MNRRLLSIVLSSLVGMAPGQVVGGFVDGGPLGEVPAGHSCITQVERAAVDAQVQAYLQAHGQTESAGAGCGTFDFYPMAGRLAGELWIHNYVDLDLAIGPILDWNCRDFTYDGHLGSDTQIRSFAEQLIGVPIYAACDGTVVAVQDGHPDMNTVPAGQPTNYVIVDHGNGRMAYYWHLKNGSVLPSVGQAVVAGEQIGLTGSSGNSTYPHLHFEVKDGGSVFEPFTGPCNAGPSQWTNQPAFNGTNVYASDFGITSTNLTGTSLPTPLPTHSEWVQSEPWLYFWVVAHNLPVQTTWQVRFLNPGGGVAFDSGVVAFNNSIELRWWWGWWQYGPVPGMTTTPGTWTLQLELDGQMVVDAPFEVVASATGLNRPPEPITVAIAPGSVPPGTSPVCEVTNDLILDDLDWDVVRYTYDWKVNGASVRTLTSAARSDRLPHTAFAPGDTISCDVTASDGVASGATVSASANAIGTFGLSLYQDAGLNVHADHAWGPPGQPFVSFYTFNPANNTSPGTGWFNGLHISLAEVYQMYGFGLQGIPPFAGVLDGAGQSSYVMPAAAAAGFSGQTVHGMTAYDSPSGVVFTAPVPYLIL